MTTAIEWCDVTWNPVVGCSRVSRGCDNCYAIGVAARNLCTQHKGLTKIRPRDASRPGPDWTGELRLVPQRLTEPLGWRKPRRVFVNSMSDLFHKGVPFPFVAAVLGVIAASPGHTFIVATKRPKRALEFFSWLREDAKAAADSEMGDCLAHAASHIGSERWSARLEEIGMLSNIGDDPWPLPNLHLLASAEDQAAWSERVPALLDVPAAVRGVSAEPLLGPIVWPDGLEQLDWLVIGGESGRGARPCGAPWIRDLATKAHAAGVAVFIKQLGSTSVGAGTQPGKGNDPSTWPEDLRVRELPRGERSQ